MAEIRGFKPLAPIWPVPPGRKVEEDDESPPQGQQHPSEEGEKGGEKKGDNGPPHIDEYA